MAKAAKNGSGKKRYAFKLYVTGANRRSQIAIHNLNSICEEYLRGQYQLEVVDIYQAPLLAKEAGVLAVPTLVKQVPPPVRRLIGDLSERQRVLMLLDLKPRTDTHGQTTVKPKSQE
jgi:circadian clock protein KaiB